MIMFRRAEFQPACSSIGLALSTLLAASSIASAYVVPRQIDTSQLLPKYDFIIVGGGTAGLTLADRLTEDPDVDVLVLEAGGFGDAAAILSINGSLTDLAAEWWPGVVTVPQVNLGADLQVEQVTVGRVVGGGSAVNGMYNMRGSADDYNRWDQLFGTAQNDIDWGWEGILPYFKKALHFVAPPAELTDQFPDSIKYNASYWGDTSDIYAGWPKFYWPGVTPLVEAFKEMEGVEFPPDSGAGQPGVYWLPSLMDPRSQTRSYARTGHYSNVIDARPNYHLLINTLVRRVLMDAGDGLTATGVEFPAENTTLITANADKEVILSAGTIHSPRLLQLSGIGPRNILEAAGIEVLLDLPGVGQNFHDHSSLFAISIVLQGLTSIHPNPSDLVPGSDFQKWAEEAFKANGSGPYSIASPNLAAWLPLTVLSPQASSLATKLEQQDFASLLPAGVHPTVASGYAAQMRLLASQMRSGSTAFARLVPGAAGGLEGPVLLQALARGTVDVNATDPWGAEPRVDYRALSNPVEADVYAELVGFYRRYNFNTSLAARFDPVERGPGPEVTSDEGLRAFVAAHLVPTDLHPVGTCSMLPLELGGVVDKTLRVWGVKGLRVVDGSIISMVPAANTCGPIYAIAEKAADLIKQGA